MAEPVRNVAVIDVGKTNAKVALVRRARRRRARAAARRPIRVRERRPLPAFRRGAHSGISSATRWRRCSARAPIDAISITAHGSAGALHHRRCRRATGWRCRSSTTSIPAPTSSPPNTTRCGRLSPKRFRRACRPASISARRSFGRSGASRRSSRRPGATSTIRNIGHGGSPASRRPRCARWARIPTCGTRARSTGRAWWSALGWRTLLAPLRSAFDRLGPVRPELARRLGLDPATPVLCGIHDSSASLLPHLKQREPPFTVVSTGTWVILFAVGGDIEKLDPTRDTLANVSAFGDPVPCARFMGGREFEQLTGGDAGRAGRRSSTACSREQIMALPNFVPGVGPFPHGKGRWTRCPEQLSPGERIAAASLYLALVTAESMAIAGGGRAGHRRGSVRAGTASSARRLSAIRGTPVAPSGGRHRHDARRGAARHRHAAEARGGTRAGRAAPPSGVRRLRRGVAGGRPRREMRRDLPPVQEPKIRRRVGVAPNRETDMAAKTKDLSDLFHETLKDIYHAEKQILRALPKMAKAAQSDELRQAFETHRDETRGPGRAARADLRDVRQARRQARPAMPSSASSRKARR